MLLAPAVIVFVGVAGKHPEQVQRQLQPVLAHSHVTPRTVAKTELANLARHSDDSKALVQAMHVDGVVGGALIESGGSLTLRVVIYDGDGNLKSLGETPLRGRTMSKDELEVLGENFADELGGLHHKNREAKQEVAEIDFDAPNSSVAPIAPPPARHAAASTEVGVDPDAPPIEPHEPKPTETADAVSLDDVAALNDSTEASGESTATASTTTHDLHLHANAGLGIASRSFSGPSGLMGYTSSAVGTARFAAGIEPFGHFALDAMGETALGMSTNIGKSSASTSMSRYEIDASYALPIGSSFAIAPMFGYGQRDFSIDSSATGRSPDVGYGYMIFGANASYALAQRFTLHGLAALEPVTGGADPSTMEFGAATRWAMDVGAGVDVRIWSHISARAGFDFQRFSWSWSAAGSRTTSSASDSYPTAAIALGAEY
jgi:opacity protein-like surface antigen